MIVVAVTSGEEGRIRGRLAELGATPVDVVALCGGRCADRRVLLADAGDRSGGESPACQAVIAARLRAEGWLAVARPNGGAALRAWQRDTAPAVFGDRVSVCLAVSEHDRSGLPNVIELGPGGFGNGRHLTTRLVIDALMDCLRPGDRVLDVGCGSGILGLVALALGASEVTATDRKHEAVEAAKSNVAINGWADRLHATVIQGKAAEHASADAGVADPKSTSSADLPPDGGDPVAARMAGPELAGVADPAVRAVEGRAPKGVGASEAAGAVGRQPMDVAGSAPMGEAGPRGLASADREPAKLAGRQPMGVSGSAPMGEAGPRGLGSAGREPAELAGRQSAEMADPDPMLDPVRLPGGFDLVLANIARAGIAELAGGLVRSVGPSGRLIVGGISPGQRSQVAGLLAPLRVVDSTTRGDWAALVLAGERS